MTTIKTADRSRLIGQLQALVDTAQSTVRLLRDKNDEQALVGLSLTEDWAEQLATLNRELVLVENEKKVVVLVDRIEVATYRVMAANNFEARREASLRFCAGGNLERFATGDVSFIIDGVRSYFNED